MRVNAMQNYQGETLSWVLTDGCLELALHREPCNEIGDQTLAELEKFVEAHEVLKDQARVLVVYSLTKAGFCAGADLRALYLRAKEIGFDQTVTEVRGFLNRIHRVMNTIDASPLTSIA